MQEMFTVGNCRCSFNTVLTFSRSSREHPSRSSHSLGMASLSQRTQTCCTGHVDGQVHQVRCSCQDAGYAHCRTARPLEEFQAAQTGCRRDTWALVAGVGDDGQLLEAGAVQ